MGMTAEEAIHVIQSNRPTSGYTMLCEALDMAIAALREQEEQENQKPLTLEELRQINAPVWCLCKPIEGGNGFWCLCERGIIITPFARFYAKDIPHWVFLRNKPKEDSNGQTE